MNFDSPQILTVGKYHSDLRETLFYYSEIHSAILFGVYFSSTTTGIIAIVYISTCFLKQFTLNEQVKIPYSCTAILSTSKGNALLSTDSGKQEVFLTSKK